MERPYERSGLARRAPRNVRAVLVSFSAWGLVLLGALVACTPHAHWQALRQELAQLRVPPVPPRSGSPFLDLRGAIHVHTHRSHDSQGQPEEILAAARRAELDFLVVTDHEVSSLAENGFSGLHEGVLVMRGAEINRPCWRLADRCPSLLVLGLRHPFEAAELELQELVDAVRDQGGLSFVAHPRGWPDWSIEGLTGIEIYDILDDALDRKHRFLRYFLDVLYSYRTYPEEVLLSILDRPAWHLKKWDELSAERKTVGIAGNDAHQNVRLWGRQLDPYELSFRFVTTHVWATSLEEESVLSALAAGRAYIAFELLADARGFRFEVPDSSTPALAGDEVALDRGVRLATHAPRPARIVLLRDGVPVRECECVDFVETIHVPGNYRVELFLRIRDQWRPWIFSNPIAIRASRGA